MVKRIFTIGNPESSRVLPCQSLAMSVRCIQWNKDFSQRQLQLRLPEDQKASKHVLSSDSLSAGTRPAMSFCGSSASFPHDRAVARPSRAPFENIPRGCHRCSPDWGNHCVRFLPTRAPLRLLVTSGGMISAYGIGHGEQDGITWFVEATISGVTMLGADTPMKISAPLQSILPEIRSRCFKFGYSVIFSVSSFKTFGVFG